MRFEKGRGPSFLNFEENVPFIPQANDTRYSFLCKEGYSSIHSMDQGSMVLNKANSDRSVRNLVLILYLRISPPPNILKMRWRFLFRAWLSASNRNMHVKVVNVSAEAAKQ